MKVNYLPQKGSLKEKKKNMTGDPMRKIYNYKY